MKLCYRLLFAAILLPLILFAQSNPLVEKLSRARELVSENKLSEADEYLEKLLNKNPGFSEGWDMLVAIRGQEWDAAKEQKFKFGETKMTVTTTDKKGHPLPDGSDTLARQLEAMLNKVSPSAMACSKYMYTIRQALLQAPEAYKSSMLWRMYHVDKSVDTNVSRKALKYFNEAEHEYETKNYHSAAQLYRRALEEQPDFFKANLYLGDAFYASENYADALVSFQAAVKRFPDLLEPQKYLCDAYAKMKLYDKALETAINAMSIYPDISMGSKLDDAAYLSNRTLNIKWTARAILPNTIKEESNRLENIDMNSYQPKEEKKAVAPWAYYQAALEKAKGACTESGIISDPGRLGGSRYLEVYSWREMLSASRDPLLDEARRMEAAGYLDCYVLVTCFHPDIYPQYKDFAARNKEKISRYYHAMLKERN